ncbi:hypothetical protein LCGC14_2315420 [marine sediment metagenome]|uniref:Uncharacterized protein n=1 Tax=marine sediment metagenome TaxID=412755 RepID=A0A0F9D707_9ZZZZ
MVPAPLIKTGSKDETRMITLEDLEVRYEQIRSVNPKSDNAQLGNVRIPEIQQNTWEKTLHVPIIAFSSMPGPVNVWIWTSSTI